MEVEDTDVLVKIQDHGDGIDNSELKKIFKRFYRIDKSRSRKTGGVGLGLSIVKRIVKMHDGKIKVTSRKGEGTEFTISLPIA